MSVTALAAAVLQVVLVATGTPVTYDDRAPAAQPSVDGTQPQAATGWGSVAPRWLGTRLLPDDPATGNGEVRPTPSVMRHRRWTLPDDVRMLPGTGFASRVVSPAPRRVIARSTWQEGCPVAASDLAWVRVVFWGFDAQRHTGELLVNSAVADDLVQVFRTLYRVRFPQERLAIARTYDPDAPSTGDGNETSAFVCRPSTGATYFSQHAYGLAIDIDSFQNPYQKGDVVLPELASSYLRRDRVRAGMITPDGPVVRAFARIGWEWGGSWRSSKDYMHFSQNGL
ncbi:D-alanyl-D-alanine carboxypeptidase [Nocardioides exalbidus]|uniref:D-alanyl-D-alanine carboxypeptidase n=1 Tax=Nocardioides exalbidus TaxID=402596 RepID=A0A1H4N5T5_9ACTN|nr:M15 family metallopeptidase [Nocardioides exalbidus]SEB90820.1 D-alanyl-D-alanine carboxypeptidase [Nocardioides exalbidus]